MTPLVAEGAQLVVVDAAEQVWRVGFKPEPWAWSGWEWAGADGRFHGRWDDRQGNFRTIYAGSTLLACLLEVLAGFRPDPTLALELDDIEEDDEDAAMHPTARAGEISYSWLEPRSAASATLTGRFCAVTAAESIAALRPQFVALAHRRNLHDFDAAALKDGRPRALTQSVATYLHATTELDGVTFAPATATTSRCGPCSSGPMTRRSAGPSTRSSTTPSPPSTPTSRRPSGSSASAGRPPEAGCRRCSAPVRRVDMPRCERGNLQAQRGRAGQEDRRTRPICR
ncbi:hypothetical protein E2C04_00575 [Nocardioides daphniae]|uniref:RES domain-containing protein n=1 Tax=Nocardioides daphniae TaxID=402297 RepID=A0A4P7U7D3_9ACTN|nr:hypothetical protein E2C04_00575 [Nocardioides daphniae]